MEPTLLAPTPGAAKPGNLYADLQSRTLWLGVDPAVDPNQAVLISDIIALEADIDQCLIDAKAYTDTRINTRAPTVHNHTSSQITDFVAAVTAVASGIPSLSYTRGMIMIYSGSLSDIGVGPLAGWSLCDGSNGTPDLRDKFVIGAGNKLPGTANPLLSLVAPSAGSHIHVINGTALGTNEMPYHSHGGITGYMSHDHAHSVNINTGGENTGHTHNAIGNFPGCGDTTSLQSQGAGHPATGQFGTTDRNVGHYHNVSGGTSGVNQNHYHGIPAEGGGGAHAHTEQYAGDHSHTMSATALRDAI